ncbi:MAG: hypothetical protein U9Q30_10460, partial [Campylobacterota bacterium]|nr:hypothetical protein [Campylobacterota bacterium]
YLSSSLNNFLKRNFNKLFIKSFSLSIYRIYQNKIEKNISRIRNKTLLQELSIEDSMSYTK